MVLKSVKTLVVGLAVLMSLSAEAKIEQFQESFSGYLPMIDSWDGVYYIGESTFSGNGYALTIQYEAFKLLQDQLYVVFGSYTRGNVVIPQMGQFDFSLAIQDPTIPADPLFDPLPIAGTFSYTDILMMPDGQLEVFKSELGVLTGFLGPQDHLTFTIDWTIYTRDRASFVPAPPSLWLFSSGLFMLGLFHLRRQHIESQINR
jgi:hypothetical protein